MEAPSKLEPEQSDSPGFGDEAIGLASTAVAISQATPELAPMQPEVATEYLLRLLVAGELLPRETSPPGKVVRAPRSSKAPRPPALPLHMHTQHA